MACKYEIKETKREREREMREREREREIREREIREREIREREQFSYIAAEREKKRDVIKTKGKEEVQTSFLTSINLHL